MDLFKVLHIHDRLEAALFLAQFRIILGNDTFALVLNCQDVKKICDLESDC